MSTRYLVLWMFSSETEPDRLERIVPGKTGAGKFRTWLAPIRAQLLTQYDEPGVYFDLEGVPESRTNRNFSDFLEMELKDALGWVFGLGKSSGGSESESSCCCS